MFGEDTGYISTDKQSVSQERLALVDAKVTQVLAESKERVTKLLTEKEMAVRDVAINLYKYDYLDMSEI